MVKKKIKNPHLTDEKIIIYKFFNFLNVSTICLQMKKYLNAKIPIQKNKQKNYCDNNILRNILWQHTGISILLPSPNHFHDE